MSLAATRIGVVSVALRQEEQPASQRYHDQQDACEHPPVYAKGKRYVGPAAHSGHRRHGSISCMAHLMVGFEGAT
jgi:hypothetical protein